MKISHNKVSEPSKTSEPKDFSMPDIPTFSATLCVPKPIGHIQFMNVRLDILGDVKVPNKFQRWMLKKVFGIEIHLYDKGE